MNDAGPLQTHAHLVAAPPAGDGLHVGLVVLNILSHVGILPEQRLLDDGAVEPLDLPRHPRELDQELLDQDDGDGLDRALNINS